MTETTMSVPFLLMSITSHFTKKFSKNGVEINF
jgi:hypothetical protein